ncbi:MAG: hypothetical protein UR26_C0001G0190 [candidate division TM6 bacterium GW2011_GWF2_32_72]|nr:MAG: hypothetical protein UR26_C0001G0190 [candidate division TM6 bacterium GW2011_GWF2_32_72]
MNRNIVKTLSLSLVITSLIFTPGCLDFLKGKKSAADDGSLVLLKIEGKSVITEKKLNDLLEMYAAAQMGGNVEALKSIPGAMKNIFNQMLAEELLLAWAEKKQIEKLEEYQKEYNQNLEFLKKALARKYFAKDLVVEITDEEIQKLYDEQKNVSPALKDKDGKFLPLADVKDLLKQSLEAQKKNMMLAQKINELKAQFNLEENNEFFEKMAGSKPDMAELMKSLQNQKSEEVAPADEMTEDKEVK